VLWAEVAEGELYAEN